jgi:hypothetical protein
MSEEYDYDEDKWEPSEKDELTAIKHTLKRMEVTQSRIYTALSVIGGILSVLVLALVFEIEPWWK